VLKSAEASAAAAETRYYPGRVTHHMLKLYGFSKLNAGARGHTRDLRVL
jgi:hypothetical protein